jgi:hypothetical protein
VLGGVAEDVNARLREPFQIWIALADLPYVQSIRDAFGLTAIDDLGEASSGPVDVSRVLDSDGPRPFALGGAFHLNSLVC